MAAMTPDAMNDDQTAPDDSSDGGFVVELKVDAQGKISGCVESAQEEAAEEGSEDGGGSDSEGGEGMDDDQYVQFGSLKEALTWAMETIRNNGTPPEQGSDEKAFSAGYGMKSGDQSDSEPGQAS